LVNWLDGCEVKNIIIILKDNLDIVLVSIVI
jgi:hypothetical protein